MVGVGSYSAAGYKCRCYVLLRNHIIKVVSLLQYCVLKLVIILILFFHVFSSLDIDCLVALTAIFPMMVPIALGSFGEHFDTVLQNYLAGTTYA